MTEHPSAREADRAPTCECGHAKEEHDRIFPGCRVGDCVCGEFDAASPVPLPGAPAQTPAPFATSEDYAALAALTEQARAMDDDLRRIQADLAAQPPTLEEPSAEPQGTFACPHCGVGLPHHHSLEEIAALTDRKLNLAAFERAYLVVDARSGALRHLRPAVGWDKKASNYETMLGYPAETYVHPLVEMAWRFFCQGASTAQATVSRLEQEHFNSERAQKAIVSLGKANEQLRAALADIAELQAFGHLDVSIRGPSITEQAKRFADTLSDAKNIARAALAAAVPATPE